MSLALPYSCCHLIFPGCGHRGSDLRIPPFFLPGLSSASPWAGKLAGVGVIQRNVATCCKSTSLNSRTPKSAPPPQPSSPPPPPSGPAHDDILHTLEKIDDWDFDVFRLQEHTKGGSLVRLSPTLPSSHESGSGAGGGGRGNYLITGEPPFIPFVYDVL